MSCFRSSFQRVKKVLTDFFARFTNATFFVKLHFTKNRALLVKKPDLSAFLMAIYPIRGGLCPLELPHHLSRIMLSFIVFRQTEKPWR